MEYLLLVRLDELKQFLCQVSPREPFLGFRDPIGNALPFLWKEKSSDTFRHSGCGDAGRNDTRSRPPDAIGKIAYRRSDHRQVVMIGYRYDTALGGGTLGKYQSVGGGEINGYFLIANIGVMDLYPIAGRRRVDQRLVFLKATIAFTGDDQLVIVL